MWFLAVQTKRQLSGMCRKSSFSLRYWRCTCLRLKNESDPSMSGRQSDHYSDVFRSLWRALPNDLHCSALFWASCHDQCFPHCCLSCFFPAWLRLSAIYMCICAKHFSVVKVKAVLTGWFALSRNTALCVYSVKCSACAIWTNAHKGRIFLPSDLEWPSLFAAVKQE